MPHDAYTPSTESAGERQAALRILFAVNNQDSETHACPRSAVLAVTAHPDIVSDILARQTATKAARPRRVIINIVAMRRSEAITRAAMMRSISDIIAAHRAHSDA
jgi:hypothetical protein